MIVTKREIAEKADRLLREWDIEATLKHYLQALKY